MLMHSFKYCSPVVQLTAIMNYLIFIIFVVAINFNFVKSQGDDIIPEHVKLDFFVLDAVKKLTYPILRKYLTTDRDALSRLGEKLAVVAERAVDNEIALMKIEPDVFQGESSNSEYEQLESTKTQHEVSILRKNVEKDLSTAESSEDLLPAEMKVVYRTLKPKTRIRM